MSGALHNRICIFGESPLVEEYASLCLNKGMEVAVRMNPDENGRSRKSRGTNGARKVRRPQKASDLGIELTVISRDRKKANLRELDAALPVRVPILSSSVTFTVAEQSGWIKHPHRLIGIGALPSLLGGSLIELVRSPATDQGALDSVIRFAVQIEKDTALVHDTVGLVIPRILSTLANEAMFAMTERVATAGDIDTAMKLTNYPHGPLEWAEKIGKKYVHAVMAALHREYGGERYQIAPLLRQSATTEFTFSLRR